MAVTETPAKSTNFKSLDELRRYISDEIKDDRTLCLDRARKTHRALTVILQCPDLIDGDFCDELSELLESCLDSLNDIC